MILVFALTGALTPTKGRHPISRKPYFVEDALFGCTIQNTPKLIPGTVLALGVVWLAILLTDQINLMWGYQGLISYILTAIIVGMLVRNTIGLAPLFQPGVSFALRKLLRLGIILLGIRLSILDVAIIGAWGVPIVIGCILTGLVITIYFTRLLGLPERLGTLIAIGTSICGASAIVAASPVIEATDEEIAYAVANITVFGIVAMFVYPYLANVLFAGNVMQVGLFTGTSIHETAQVAGAGLIYDQSFGVSVNPSAADVAVVTKLVRNVMMILVIPAMAFLYARRAVKPTDSSDERRPRLIQLIPIFIIGFLIVAVIRSIGDANLDSGVLAFGIWSDLAWNNICGNIKELSGYILAMAMAGVGLGTSFGMMRGLGIKPFGVGLVSATMVGVSSVLLVLLLGPMVNV